MINFIKIISLDDMSATELQQIDERLRTLLLCVEETVPGSRAFGLSRDFLDMPINAAASRLAVELQEKTDIYIPEIKIDAVDTVYDVDGRLTVTVSIRKRSGGR